MTAYSAINPYPIFLGLDGNALNGGEIYIGVAGMNPVTNPKAVWWDSAGTIAASQPLITIGGYIVNNNDPAQIYIDGDYSILITDRFGQQVAYATNVNSKLGEFIALLASNAGAAQIGSGDGDTVQKHLDEIAVDMPKGVTAYNWYTKKLSFVDRYVPQAYWAGIAAHTSVVNLDAYLAAAAADLDGTELTFSEGQFTFTTWDLKGRAGFEIRGENPQGVLFNPTAATGTLIDIGSATAGVLSGGHIHGLGINSPTNRTSGSSFRIRNMSKVYIENFWLAGQFTAFEFGEGCVACVLGGAGFGSIINPTSTTGNGVILDGATLTILQNLLIEGNQSVQAESGIKLIAASDVKILDCSATFSRDGLLVTPGGSDTVEYVWSRGNTFDTGAGSGIKLTGTGTISVFESTDDWCATNGARGVWLNTGPTINNVQFKGLQSYNNAQEGLRAENCTSRLSISHSTIAGNSTSLANVNDGIYIACGASAVPIFSVIGCSSGQNGQFTNAQRYGCYIAAGTSQRYIVQGNDFSDNATGGLSDNGTASEAKSVTGNLP